MNLKLWGLVLLLLALLTLRFYQHYAARPSYKVGQEMTLETTLLSESQIAGQVQKFYVDDILVIAPRFPEYHYGDALIISGTLEGRVISNKRLLLMLYFPKVENHSTSSWLALAKFIRQKITTVVANSLPNIESGLILGILLGFKENLPKEFINELRISGTLHVIAASGMNVAMVGAFLSHVFALIFRRQLALIFTIFGIIAYAILAGLEPSIVRAGIMGAISFAALILGRQNLALLSLFLVGYLMLFIKPQIIFDIGFQLSFLATLGLITIKPILDNKWTRINKYQIGNDLTTTIAAQIATLPILLSNFGTYSLFSIIANTLVLWTVAPIMVLGGIAGIFSFFLEPISRIILTIALPFLLFFEKVVSLFASFGSQVKIEELPMLVSLGYYLVVTSIFLVLRSRDE